MKEEKYKCHICSISHSYSSDNLNISNYNDEKLLCSSCINKLLSKDNNNNLVFPNVFIDIKFRNLRKKRFRIRFTVVTI